MRRITCRNGCIFVAAICLVWMAPFARGGTLDDAGAPTDAGSAMWTLDNIYSVLDTRTTNVTKRTGGFTEPTAGPAATMYSLDEIMTLATNRAAVPKTGVTAVWNAHDDGTLKIGVAWPTPRFTAVTNTGPGTNQIRDNLTGLIWAQDANLAANSFTWLDAFNVITNNAGPVNGASYGGATDWRLPNVRELFSLLDYSGYPALPAGHPFANVQNDYYWSSSGVPYNPSMAYCVNPYTGYVSGPDGTGAMTTLYYVWPVRGGR